ncbi:hypothetical protein PoB_001680900 [Plakobranchus ocellatus]|uniref:Link domain-containing protein n=1 Tax=Plakobranchus ocellatus TaxID=259542 RepID=A0AAV3Z7D9_9GAST|nr:hypothetical protein PoB_001680900 [Plakobranchus ocellatus]
MTSMQVWTVVLVAMLAIQSSAEQTTIMNFTFTASRMNVVKGERLCRELGYDGLGVLKTPEAYAYALRLSEPFCIFPLTYIEVWPDIVHIEWCGCSTSLYLTTAGHAVHTSGDVDKMYQCVRTEIAFSATVQVTCMVVNAAALISSPCGLDNANWS